MEDLAAFFPIQSIETAREISQHSVRRALLDLAYLEPAPYIGSAELDAAIAAFRSDYRRAGLVVEPLDSPSAAPGSLSVGEGQLLRRLTGWEGDFLLDRLPVPGETCLYSRIARMRLDLFGFGAGYPRSSAFAQHDLRSLRELAGWDGAMTPQDDAGDEHSRLLAALNGAGNPSELIRRVWKKSLPNRVVYFYSDKGERGRKLDGAFIEALRSSLPPGSHVFRDFLHNAAGRGGPVVEYTKAQVADRMNRRVLRFIQIMTWLDGHYLNQVDEDFGPLTRDSIAQSLDESNFLEERQPHRFDELMAYLGKGYWVLNQKVFFDYLFRETNDHPAAAQATAIDQNLTFVTEFEASLSRLGPAAAAAVQRQLSAIGEEIAGGGAGLAAKPLQMRQGVRFPGIRRWLLRLREFFSRLIDRLLNGDATNQVRSAVHALFSEIADAIALFRSALGFIMGKNDLITLNAEGKAPSLYSGFGADFDTTALVSAAATVEQIESHRELCRQRSDGLAALMELMAIVIRVVMTVTPKGWLQLALLIARTWRQMRSPIALA